jgi:hypothetical protein
MQLPRNCDRSQFVAVFALEQAGTPKFAIFAG